MKICIDGFGVTHLHGTGLYTYTYEMLDNLFELFPQPKYTLLWDESTHVSKWDKHRNIEYRNLILNRRENKYRKLEDFILENKISIYHSPNNGFSIPENKECRQVITVHDILPAISKQYVDEKYYTKFHKIFPVSLEKSDKIISVSDFIKKQLIQEFNVSQEKIEVIYPGVSHIFKPMEEDKCREFLKSKYQIEDEFLLYVGSIHPRKNIETLIEVFKSIKRNSDNLKLVIVGKCDGKRKEYYLKLKRLAKSIGVEESVIFTGRVNYMEMPFFYNGSKCFINFSEYDGFPITTLEAIACDKIVICNDTPSVQEIFNNKIYVVNSKEKNETKDIILEAINIKQIYIKNLLEKQKKQIEKYNWNNAIRKLVSVYESIGY